MQGPQTLLFLHPAPDRYGPDVALLEIVRGLDPSRWRAVVAIEGDGPLCEHLREAGAEVVRGPLGVVDGRALRSPLGLLRLAFQIPRAAFFVRRLARNRGAALVHTNTSTVVGGALGARLSGLPHLWHVHELADRPTRSARTFAWLAARLADVVVSNSEATRASLDRLSPVLAAKHRVVLNGVARARVAADADARSAVRRELGLEDGAQVVALVGRVNGWKGHELLLDAAERLQLQRPDARFLLVGDAPTGQAQHLRSLERQIDERDLGARVQLVPHRDDIGRIYAAADVVVVPSTRPEPFGLVAIEAMAAGRPVVAAAHGGLLEVIEPGRTGLLFEPGNLDRLVFALDALIGDPRRARDIGARGREEHARAFSAARFVDDLDRIWLQFTGAPRALTMDEAHVVHVLAGATDDYRARVVQEVASAEAVAGLDVELWTISAASEGPDAAEDAGTGEPHTTRHFVAQGTSSGLDPALAGAVDALGSTALVHLHGGCEPALAAVAARLAVRRLPYVVSPHGAYRTLARKRDAGRRGGQLRAHERGMLDGARAVHVFTELEGHELADVVAPERIAVVPCGQEPLPPVTPTQVEVDVRRPLFGYGGPLDVAEAGLDVLLDAFALHVASEGGGSLWFIGDGDDRAALEAHAQDLGIGRRVRFQGALSEEERLAHLAALDVFVHPAHCVTMATAVLEALALGKPVVVTRGTGLADEVKRAGIGFGVAAVDAEALAAALSASDREHDGGMLAARGVAARELLAAEFGWSCVAARLTRDLYELAPSGDAGSDGAATAAPVLEIPQTVRKSA